MNPRRWMAIRCRDLNLVSDSRVHTISLDDVPALAHLMDVAYQGTIDHEGETLEQCADEQRATINGKYGPFVANASHVVMIDGLAASACLVTMWKEKPLIAFTMTDPKFQRQGLSRHVIELAISALPKDEILYLVVTEANTAAYNLYLKIGFQDLGPAKGGTPPPDFD